MYSWMRSWVNNKKSMEVKSLKSPKNRSGHWWEPRDRQGSEKYDWVSELGPLHHSKVSEKKWSIVGHRGLAGREK